MVRLGRGEERPSASLGTNEDEAAREGDRLAAGKHRDVQVARSGGRKLFDKERRKVFLEWFAATCNVKMAAERAEVAYQTVFKHRMKDEAFAAAWDRALAQGYARLEAKMLETQGEPIAIDGDWEAPEPEGFDRTEAIQLLREHKRSVGGNATPFGAPRKQGRGPRVASNSEVREALVKRLAAFGVRISSGADAPAGEEGVPIAAQPAPPPPFGWSPSPGKPGEE